MQNTTVSIMANSIVDQLIDQFNNRVEDFTIYNLDEDVNHKQFNVDFTAYNYYICTITYERGSFGCSIKNGKHFISLKSTWYDEVDFNIFFKELKEELELRIPDKYLEVKGWK